MEYRAVGQSGLRVSAVGLGCNNFGIFQDAAQARACIHRALDVGITLFDMASEHGAGREEELVGAALGSRRKEVVLATKFGQPEMIGLDAEGCMTFATDSERQGASRRWIMQSVEESLTRLKTDYIDLYQPHVVDEHVAPDETMRALEDLVRQGKVRAIGLAATFAGVTELEALQTAATANGWTRFAAMQANYNLLARDAERALLPALTDRQMSLLPYWPLANGLLSGKYRPGTVPAADSRLRKIPMVQGFYQEADWRKVEAIARFADTHGVPMAELAVAWLLTKPAVASVIAGASRPEQVTQNAGAADRRLDPAEVAELETLLGELS